MKRQWPFQPVIPRPFMLLSSANTAQPADYGGVSSLILEENEPKRIGLLGEEASSSSSPITGAAPFDGSMLKLGPPCVPVPCSTRSASTQQHGLLTLQPPQRITEIPASPLETGCPLVRPVLLNFMGLPEHVKEEQRAAIESAFARQQPVLFEPALHNFMGLPEHVMEEQRAAIKGVCAWRQPALSMDSPVDLIRSKPGGADAHSNASTD
ncbi:hypothetical protein HPP92_000590 [Vanilla planifolia]|uniref:Uncharacterized protein n=1 Tax=Vanilla planifolia TaxID=51239 RepID=A0A835RUQ7_VANPL|nr:hypothetical protein HPP92_000590 [Vanilla planifolia]